MSWWPNVRILILFFGGLAGVAHETLVMDFERQGLLILFGAMMGLSLLPRGRRLNGNGG